MNIANSARFWIAALLGPCLAAAAAQGSGWAAPADQVLLAPHRAIYDLKLSKSRGSRGIEAVRGRILYDFSGNACEGYELQFRQVSELDSGEGKISTSDLRSTTWEGADAKRFTFTSQNFVDQNLVDSVDGPPEATLGHVLTALEKYLGAQTAIGAPS